MKSFKVKINGIEKELYFKVPSHAKAMSIDLEYRKNFAEGVRTGLMTNAEAAKVFKKSGAWTLEDDREATDLISRIAILESVIESYEKNKNDSLKLHDQIKR